MRVPHALVAVVTLVVGTSLTDVSSGFSQKEVALGHCYITHWAGVAAGGMFAEPTTGQVDVPTAACGATCDSHGTKNWNTWSAVMGQRWLDLGGFNAVKQVGRKDVIGQKSDCFEATMQDADDVQYAHALRRRCDSGGAGLRRAYDGLVEFIHKRFLASVDAPDGPMWFRDGGTSVEFRKANRPAFLLGLALHALQDSFSEEHTTRTADWHSLADIKTYVDTPGVARHADVKKDPGKFLGGDETSLNLNNGDYAWTTLPLKVGSPLKPAAKQALDASKDLMVKFEAARKSPGQKEALWRDFVINWLRFAPSASAASSPEPNPKCASDTKDTEKWRTACIKKIGREQGIGDIDYPRFCFDDARCK